MKRSALKSYTPLRRGTSQLKRSRLNPKRKKPVSKVRIDYAQFEFGKRTTQPKPSIVYHSDGRQVCNLRTPGGFDEYRRRINNMLERQGGLCSLGGEPLSFIYATFEHGAGRNKNRRDDRIDIVDAEGFFLNSAACAAHNCKKGSRRNYPIVIRLRPESAMEIETVTLKPVARKEA